MTFTIPLLALAPGRAMFFRPEHLAPTREWVIDNDQCKPLVQTHLACTTLPDHQVARLLGALEEPGQAGNPIVVPFGDHGFHHGEKSRWARRSLWQDEYSGPPAGTSPEPLRRTGLRPRSSHCGS